VTPLPIAPKSVRRDPDETFPGRSRDVLAPPRGHWENLSETKPALAILKCYPDRLLGVNLPVILPVLPISLYLPRLSGDMSGDTRSDFQDVSTSRPRE
jgi:hypothetical protein